MQKAGDMHVRVIMIIYLLCFVTTVFCQGPRKIGPDSVYIHKNLQSRNALLHSHDGDDGIIMMTSRRLLEDSEVDEEKGESVGNEQTPLNEENPQHKKIEESEPEPGVVQEADNFDKEEELQKDVEPISLSQNIKEEEVESNPMKKVENKTVALDEGRGEDEIDLGISSYQKGTVGITEINKADAKVKYDDEIEHQDDNTAPISLDKEQKSQGVSHPVHILSKEADVYNRSSNTTMEVEEQQGENVVSEIAVEVPSPTEEDNSGSKSVSHLVHTTSNEVEGYEGDDRSSKTTTEVEEWDSEIVTNGVTAPVHNVSKEEDGSKADDRSSIKTTKVEDRESEITTNGGSAPLHNVSKEEDGYEGDDRSSKTTTEVEEQESETTANGGSAPVHNKSQEEDEYEEDDRSSKTTTNVEERESETSTNGGSASEGGEFGDFMEDFTGLGSKFHNTAQRVAQHLRPDLERLSNTSKLYFDKASQKMVERFLPLIGSRYAPWVACLISYSLPLFPLLIAFKLFQHIRVLVSLQKVLLFINIYLTAYFVTLMLASITLGSEPMTFFHHNSLPGYIYLQLLQALAYLIYLVLQTSHIVDSYSSPSCTLPGKISATVQWVVSHFFGLHYYVTVFHLAMDLRPPHTNWRNYGVYSIAFFTLCLFARVKRLKKEYLPLGDDEGTTDKMN